MDPLGRCITAYFVFLIYTAFFAACAAAMSTLRAPDEDGDDEDGALVNLLYEKKNAYRYRLLCAAGTSVLVCGAVAYPLCVPFAGLFPDRWSVFAKVILLIAATVLPCSVGLYLPTALIERAGASPALYRMAKVGLRLAVPFSFIPAALSRLVMRIASVDPDRARSDVTEQEILQLVDEGESSGAINSEEREMIENIFDFSEQTVREVMKHYMDVAAIKEGDGDDAILELISGTGYSRYPVYHDDITEVIGVMLAKEYLCNRLSSDPKPFCELIRDPLFVPETMQVDNVRRAMNDSGQHMAIVVNEYGEATGIVTMEDLLEEIVGNIYDETDTAEERESDVKKLGDAVYLVRATCPLDEFEDETGARIGEIDGIDTIGALVFSKLKTIPDDGIAIDVEANGLMIHSDGLTERRLDRVVVTVLQEHEE